MVPGKVEKKRDVQPKTGFAQERTSNPIHTHPPKEDPWPGGGRTHPVHAVLDASRDVKQMPNLPIQA